MTEDARRAAMEAAIAEAAKCIPEDDRHHPMVGAVLTDAAGTILLTSHRGEDRKGGHAEYLLFAKAEDRKLDLSDKVLFVTLEPCSRRSLDKTPCVVRVVESGVRTVFIGTLDPNPQIIGRGVNHLIASGVTVEHFPAALRGQLADMNATFQGTHSYLVDPVIATTGGSPRQAAGILATTLDLIANAKGEVRIFAGDTSWLPKLFVGLLEAGLRRHPIRLLAQKALGAETVRLARAVGVTVCQVTADTGIRGTLTMKGGAPKELLLIEKVPALHALTFSAPHEAGLLQAYADRFEAAWDGARSTPGDNPLIVEIPFSQVEATLRANVPAYADARMVIETIDLADLKKLTDEVEIFKLRRVASTRRLVEAFDLKEPSRIVGTPWGFFLPVVERAANGDLTLIDGIHRVHHAERNREGKLRAVVIEGVEAPLPCKPLAVQTPRIVAFKSPRETRYSDYVEANFRPLRAAMALGIWASAEADPS
ncbi:hypothetical protein [Caulobacter sp. Root487D2Y]|uniref:hypothetical protein n=1 Tax=Caulobacter sp. Root487D2Y TaxID=1736547 RepID=UPI001F3970DB|nr:hypothetical protein [Caulobacter sp. Root487D2Y]